MDIQTVSTTYAQRNFSKLLNSRKPVAIVRDSLPEVVLIGYGEYLRMKEFEKEQLRTEFKKALDKMHSLNKNIDEKELDGALKEALNAAGRN